MHHNDNNNIVNIHPCCIPHRYPQEILSLEDFPPTRFRCSTACFPVFLLPWTRFRGAGYRRYGGGARMSILLVYIDDATVQDLLFTLPLLMLCSKIFSKSNSAHGKLWSNCVPPGETKKCQEQDFWTFCSREVSLPTVHFLRPSQEGWKYAKCTWHILTYWAKDAHFQWTERNSHWNWEFIIFEICENTAFQSNRDIPRWIYNMTPHVRFPRRVVDRWSRKLISPTNESKGEAQWTSWPMDRWTEPLSKLVAFRAGEICRKKQETLASSPWFL